jgi:hypothetical protein
MAPISRAFRMYWLRKLKYALCDILLFLPLPIGMPYAEAPGNMFKV